MEGLQLAVNESRLADVCRRYKVRELAVFGSVLRDDFTPTSDVDVLVEFEPDTPVRSLFDFIRVKQDLEDEVFHRQVDLIEQSTLHPLIASKVLHAKRTVYVTAH
ncbi:MAG: nucleotidyltransferase family protein [Thermaerobacter sp.]|nr:nucleotidyltransferase family protein [Thermaerobacter sp.]